jgi:hypothetical protein
VGNTVIGLIQRLFLDAQADVGLDVGRIAKLARARLERAPAYYGRSAKLPADSPEQDQIAPGREEILEERNAIAEQRVKAQGLLDQVKADLRKVSGGKEGGGPLLSIQLRWLPESMREKTRAATLKAELDSIAGAVDVLRTAGTWESYHQTAWRRLRQDVPDLVESLPKDPSLIEPSERGRLVADAEQAFESLLRRRANDTGYTLAELRLMMNSRLPNLRELGAILRTGGKGLFEWDRESAWKMLSMEMGAPAEQSMDRAEEWAETWLRRLTPRALERTPMDASALEADLRQREQRLEQLIEQLDETFLLGPKAPKDSEERYLKGIRMRVWMAARQHFEALPIMQAALEEGRNHVG